MKTKNGNLKNEENGLKWECFECKLMEIMLVSDAY